MSTNRNIVIERLQKELIGPGSDIFYCKEDFSDEIIEGKPLQRYFSGILFPKQVQPDASDNGELEMNGEASSDDGNNPNDDDSSDDKTDGTIMNNSISKPNEG